ncbi:MULTISPECIES: hypothetical protein [unclassified Shewanella]|uniref:hypothetical protein n=1 Tax=unclassified Shewanella TaxID=196818 RepID=UPI000C8156F9|nr:MULTISPECIES: hypothetical protein [unclassified Shewanella]MDO6678039.1 hypothetical protein [Shewanella sp. 4_MG-2023]PMG49575.1 hypothetical protein BCU91_02570 [Shewanella sp. 10N.286.52.B9]PMH86159.1 hypothetical protein BCU57_11745 [Shewanella sp. 10N.286.48.B5]
MKRIFIASLVSVILVGISGCSSMTAQNATCDFIQGAHDSAKEREEREARPGATASLSKNKDVQEGVISAIFGSIFRSSDDECELKPYTS